MILDYNLIGKRIKNYRIKKNITQNKLSELLDVSNVYVSRIERGKAKINLEMLFKISNILNVSISLLLIGIDQDADNYLDLEIVQLLKNCNVQKKKMICDIIKVIVNS